MISASEIGGLMAMIPTFTTPDGGELHVRDTINVAGIHDGVAKILRDGATAIATTGSFGEPINLLDHEFELHVNEVVKAVDKRVPVIVGVITTNTRKALEYVKVAKDAGADAVMCSVPYYYEQTIENVVQYYKDIAETFPDLGMFMYHNPIIHKTRIPVSAFHEIVKLPNFVGMKDSHRSPEEFDELMSIIRGKISTFVLPHQYVEYAEKGAAGVWAIDAWNGPEPFVKLVALVKAGRLEEARQLAHDVFFVENDYCDDLRWRETGHKVVQRYCGYIDPGPLRRPYVHIPPEVDALFRRRATYWKALREKVASIEV